MTASYGRRSSDESRRDSGRDRALATSRSVALIALVVSATALSGCAGVFSSGGETWTAGGEDVPAVVQNNMETQPTTIYDRVEDLVGVNVSEPNIVALDGRGPQSLTTDAMRHLVGEAAAAEASPVATVVEYDALRDRMRVNRDRVSDLSATELEVEFAAAYFDAIRFEADLGDPSSGDVAGPTLGARRMVVTEYTEQYNGTYHDTTWLFDEDGASDVARIRYAADQAVWHEWVRSEVESADEIPSLYERDDLPATTENALHDTDDRPRNLTVSVESGDLWIATNRSVQRFGEVGTRELLATRLGDETARAAAAGWGNDHARTVTSATNESEISLWIHRWDTEADADEFADAAGTYLDRRRAEADDVAFRLERPGPNATVVVAADGVAPDTAAFTAEKETVTVWIGESPSED